MSSAIATFNAVERMESRAGALPAFEITREQIDLIKTTVMPGAGDQELNLFLNLCKAKRLDPLTKQIYAIKPRNGGWQFFASIDGLRVIAQRTGEYGGQTAPMWCGADGVWREVWLDETTPPSAAKIGVWKRGYAEPTWGVATFKSYGKGKTANWLTMPEVMLAKCAEALALRKAFPDDMSGLYVREEFSEEPEPRPSTREPLITQEKADQAAAAYPANAVYPPPPPQPIEAQVINHATGEILSVDEADRLIERGLMHPPEPESLTSVKRQIQRLVRYLEYSDEDLALVAGELKLPGWRAMDLDQAQTLRRELLARHDAHEADRASEPEPQRIIDAETRAPGEVGNDGWTNR